MTDPFRRDGADFAHLAETAPTRLERLYYGHRGRPIMKWRQYLPLYDAALARYVGRPATVIEIGLAGGGSLQLWRNFLGPQVRLIGVDIDPACRAYAEPGVEIMIGDQGDLDFLRRVIAQAGPIDVVIDDGSHIVSHQITTMETLFPHLQPDGLYACEDLHTSYWEPFGGGYRREGSYIEYVKALIDKLHQRYHGAPMAEDDIARSIASMTLGDSIALFQKAPPTENFMVHVGA